MLLNSIVCNRYFSGKYERKDFINLHIFNQYKKKDDFVMVNKIRIFISRIYPSFVKSPVSKSSSEKLISKRVDMSTKERYKGWRSYLA